MNLFRYVTAFTSSIMYNLKHPGKNLKFIVSKIKAKCDPYFRSKITQIIQTFQVADKKVKLCRNKLMDLKEIYKCYKSGLLLGK